MGRKSDQLNPRQEAFCREYIATGVGRWSYVKAGYRAKCDDISGASVADVCASQLLRNPKVEKRIQGLRQAMQTRKDVTEDSIIDELEQARKGAMNAEQHAAAVQASVAKAKLVGLMIDRKEVRRGDIENMSEAELRAYLNEDSPVANAPGSDSRQ